jgi:hypothetical protein
MAFSRSRILDRHHDNEFVAAVSARSRFSGKFPQISATYFNPSPLSCPYYIDDLKRSTSIMMPAITLPRRRWLLMCSSCQAGAFVEFVR